MSFDNSEDFIEDYEDSNKFSTTKLVDGIDVGELIKNKETCFSIDSNFQEALEIQGNSFYEGEELLKNVKLELIEDEMDRRRGVSAETVFEEMALKMQNVPNCGEYLKKMVIKEGVGSVIPPQSKVTFHFNGYIEHNEEPYDSSYMRRRPEKHHLQNGTLLPAFVKAIETMKRKEVSQFLVHPDFAYGKLGAPPRIPQNATLLLEIELLDSVEDGEYFEDSKEDISFEKLLTRANFLRNEGNLKFNQNDNVGASNRYKKAVHLIINCQMKNEAEEQQQKQVLLKLFSNLSNCCLKLNQPKHSCKWCQEALKIDPKNVKVLYHYGKAQYMLGEYDQALMFLKRAQRLKPSDSSIAEEIRKVDRKKQQYTNSDIKFSRKMFGFKSTVNITEIERENSEPKVSDAFIEEAERTVKEFLEGPAKALNLPHGLTAEELKCFENEASKNGLKFKNLNGQSLVVKE